MHTAYTESSRNQRHQNTVSQSLQRPLAFAATLRPIVSVDILLGQVLLWVYDVFYANQIANSSIHFLWYPSSRLCQTFPESRSESGGDCWESLLPIGASVLFVLESVWEDGHVLCVHTDHIIDAIPRH